MTDEQIVKLVQGGEIEEYGKIVKAYEGRLYGYVRNLTNQGREEVEDLVEDILIKGYENIQGFDITKSFSSWIFRIAHNTAIDFFKKKKLKQENIEDKEEILISNDKLIEELEIEKEEKKLIQKALEKLELNYKEVIILYFFEERSYEEIADILHTSTSNVGVLLSRSKEKLKKILMTNGK